MLCMMSRYRNFSPLLADLKLPRARHSSTKTQSPKTSSIHIPYRNSSGRNAKPFINSEAHKLKVQEKYGFLDNSSRIGYYSFPLGTMLVAFLVYWALVHVYGLTDASVYEYLTRDISDKLPPHQREIMKQKKLGEEEEKNDTPKT